MTRRTFPMDRRKPVTSVRYDGAGVSVLATDRGVAIDVGVRKSLDTSEAVAIARTIERAAGDHFRLSKGQPVEHEGETT